MDTPFPRLRHETLSVIHTRMSVQDTFNIRIRKRVEPQRRDCGVWRHGGQVPAIVVPKPIGLAARYTEAGSSQIVEACTNFVEGRQCVGGTSPHLVKSVDEQRFSLPFGMATHRECYEIARGDQDGFLANLPALDFERGGLAGSGVSEQDIRRLGAEFLQGPGVFLPVLIRLILCNLAAGARDRVCHSASNHSLAGTLRNSLSGTPRSPTSTERRGANRLLNSAMPLTPADLEPLFASMATNLGPRFSTKSTSIELLPPVVKADIRRCGVEQVRTYRAFYYAAPKCTIRDRFIEGISRTGGHESGVQNIELGTRTPATMRPIGILRQPSEQPSARQQVEIAGQGGRVAGIVKLAQHLGVRQNLP